jgi:hypothetical protein
VLFGVLQLLLAFTISSTRGEAQRSGLSDEVASTELRHACSPLPGRRAAIRDGAYMVGTLASPRRLVDARLFDSLPNDAALRLWRNHLASADTSALQRVLYGVQQAVFSGKRRTVVLIVGVIRVPQLTSVPVPRCAPATWRRMTNR